MSVAAAKQTLDNHHSAQMATRKWEWKPQSYAVCGSCTGWRYHNQIAKDAETKCLCGDAWPKKDIDKAKAIASRRRGAKRKDQSEESEDDHKAENQKEAERQEGLRNAPWKKTRWTRAGAANAQRAPANEVERTQGLIIELRELNKTVAIPDLQLPEPDKEAEIALREVQPEQPEED